MKRRVVVYGNPSLEKEKLVSTLQTSSGQNFSFESSTPNNRFTHVDTGFATPIYTAPWQLLAVGLDQERLEQMTEFENLFPQCDLHRPLIILFYGEESPKTGELVAFYKESLASNENVSVITTTELEMISTEDLISEFSDLDITKKISLDNPSTFDHSSDMNPKR